MANNSANSFAPGSSRGAIAIVLAAGLGQRFGAKKQFARIGKESVLDLTLELILSIEAISCVVLALQEEDIQRIGPRFESPKLASIRLIRGGESRQESISRAISYCQHSLDLSANPKVLLFDANRPATPPSVISRLLKALDFYPAACPTVPLIDGVATVAKGFITNVPDKGQTVTIQTPEAFRILDYLGIPQDIRLHPRTLGITEAFSRHGLKVRTVSGDERGRKITFAEDLQLVAELLDGSSQGLGSSQ